MSRLRLMACAAGAVLLLAAPVLAQTAPLPVEIPSEDQAELGVFGFDLNGMDTSTKPGDDFNRYTSGSWLTNTPIPADKASYGMFNVLADRADANLREIIEESAANPTSTPDAARIGAFYASFMDEAAVDALGAGPLQHDLDEVRAADTREKLAALMGRTQYGFGASLFGVQTFEDLRTPDRISAYVVQSGLGMPDRDYYLEDRFATQKAAYRAYVEQSLTLAGWAEPGAAADAILAFETAIAHEHWTQVENRQIDKIYNPMTVTELTTAAPGFDWAGWATAAGVGVDRTLIAANNTAFPGMARIFAETPVETLQSWEAFHVIDQAAPYLSQAFVDARFEFYGKTLSGQQETAPAGSAA